MIYLLNKNCLEDDFDNNINNNSKDNFEDSLIDLDYVLDDNDITFRLLIYEYLSQVIRSTIKKDIVITTLESTTFNTNIFKFFRRIIYKDKSINVVCINEDDILAVAQLFSIPPNANVISLHYIPTDNYFISIELQVTYSILRIWNKQLHLLYQQNIVSKSTIHKVLKKYQLNQFDIECESIVFLYKLSDSKVFYHAV